MAAAGGSAAAAGWWRLHWLFAGPALAEKRKAENGNFRGPINSNYSSSKFSSSVSLLRFANVNQWLVLVAKCNSLFLKKETKHVQL